MHMMNLIKPNSVKIHRRFTHYSNFQEMIAALHATLTLLEAGDDAVDESRL